MSQFCLMKSLLAIKPQQTEFSGKCVKLTIMYKTITKFFANSGKVPFKINVEFLQF